MGKAWDLSERKLGRVGFVVEASLRAGRMSVDKFETLTTVSGCDLPKVSQQAC